MDHHKKKTTFHAGDLIQERYQVLKSIGEGSMGEVLLVLDQFIDRPVAMKLLKSHIAVKEEHLLRFIDEAKCQARLQHPGVISVYDIGRAENGQLFFTMRAVNGINFEKLIAEIHQLTQEQGLWGVTDHGWSFRRLIQALKQCADAVGFAHTQGIVHRDLKPQNLIIGPHGDPLVLDWGIAKYLGTEYEPSDLGLLKHFVTPLPTEQSSELDSSDEALETETIDLQQLGFNPQTLPLESDSFFLNLDPTPVHHIRETRASASSPPPPVDEPLAPHHYAFDEDSLSQSIPSWLTGSHRSLYLNSMRSVYEELNTSHISGTFKSVSTLAGTITGTPAYMSPEQAKGLSAEVDPTTDVYALGCILYHILCGAPPYRGREINKVLNKVKVGSFASLVYNPRESLPSSQLPHHDERDTLLDKIETSAPEALIRICSRAMSYKSEDRYADGLEFSSALGEWINGVQQRQEALSLLANLGPIRARQATLAREAKALDHSARMALKELPSWASEDEKSVYWRLEDQATALREEIESLDFEVELTLQSTRSLVGDLVELHQEAADHYMSAHMRLIDAQRHQEATRAIAYLKEHAQSLPHDHPKREDYLAYLRGEGQLSLKLGHFEQIRLSREELKLRRLVPGEEVSSERLKLHSPRLENTHTTLNASLPSSSYVLFLKRGNTEIAYPLRLDPRSPWNLASPRGERSPIIIPPDQYLSDHEIFIPGGWCRCGDLDAPRAVPPIRLWVDSFVVQRHPVTHQEYLCFLNDLLKQGRVEEALKHSPQEMSTDGEHQRALLYRFSEESGFSLPENAEEMSWKSESPVVMVSWWDACAYAAWLSERTQRPWRLISEWEWEKAARGVDGRAYPWGNYIDPSWCCNRLSHRGEPGTQPVGTFPVDSSPYDVCGMAGNTADWTLSPHEDEPELTENGIAPPPDLESAMNSQLPARVAKGGAWDDGPAFCHSAVRHRGVSKYRRMSLSFRLAYSVSAEEEARWVK